MVQKVILWIALGMAITGFIALAVAVWIDEWRKP